MGCDRKGPPTRRECTDALKAQTALYGDLTQEGCQAVVDSMSGEPKSRRQLERALQRECWRWAQTQWWRRFFRRIATERSDNQDRLDQRSQGGLEAGWWDFELWIGVGGYRGLILESKCLKNDLTDWQIIRQPIYADAGFACVAFWDTLDNFIHAVNSYLEMATAEERDEWLSKADAIEKQIGQIRRIDDWSE